MISEDTIVKNTTDMSPENKSLGGRGGYGDYWWSYNQCWAAGAIRYKVFAGRKLGAHYGKPCRKTLATRACIENVPSIIAAYLNSIESEVCAAKEV